MACLAVIATNLAQFPPMEKKIAEYILENPKKIKELSSQELATILSISQSGVVKFTQKLGFKGYSAFKLAISEELGRSEVVASKSALHLHNEITGDDTLLEIAGKLLLEKQSALHETMNALQPQIFEQVVEQIFNAKKVHITGVGGSALIAKDLTYKLLKIGIPAFSEMDSHVQLTIAQTLGPDDVQIAVSYSGMRREVVLAAEVAKKQGAKLVTITSLKSNPLKDLADYVLHSVADESQWRSSSISSRTAQNAITDLLFMGLVQHNQEHANALIQQSRELVNKISL
ncbi:SIS domain-containing protein [Jinshanibacter sp. LJY008]|uniref:SIS domain-containing protein n=1 Tax=Limnobaculum eriocheiris TaxID=2897391 RepID=A0A9X1MWW5_9GAMM|nr:SIS domain-containing protein [Limnobaculum eriocheiris]MCD1127076.1 SIS domain-containing protein [Limnobaculum eriocheiris]